MKKKKDFDFSKALVATFNADGTVTPGPGYDESDVAKLKVTVLSPTGTAPKSLTKDDVWGKHETENSVYSLRSHSSCSLFARDVEWLPEDPEKKREIVGAATAAHAQYPQYKGHWDGPEWRLVRVTRKIEGRFERGDITIARVTATGTDRDGMVVARSGQRCPHFGDEIPYKSVTVVCGSEQQDDVTYWLEHVHGAGCVSKTKRLPGGKVAIRSNYMAW